MWSVTNNDKCDKQWKVWQTMRSVTNNEKCDKQWEVW